MMAEAGRKPPSPHDIERLELVIFMYLQAARLRNGARANDFRRLLEKLAAEIGYEDHERLRGVYAQAERDLQTVK